MKNKMKKRIATGISTITVVALLTGCASTDSSVEIENAPQQTEKETVAETTVAKEATGELEASAIEYTYKITDTGQSECYDNEGNLIEPVEGEECYGQDAQYDSYEPSFTDNGDGTITDNVTGLTWQQIPISETMSWEDAIAYCEDLELAGYDDWRIPTAKELFGLSDFSEGWPFLDTDYFEFPEYSANVGPADGGPQGGGPQGGSSDSENGGMPPMPEGGELPEGEMPPMPEGGELAEGEIPPMPEGADKAAGAELLDGELAEGEMPPPPQESTDDGSVSKAQGQFWSANFYYAGTTHGGQDTAFGVNHATGHIKGYPSDVPAKMGKYVRAVRGEEVAVNDFADNGDGTITDESTGLMWMQDDNGEGIEWDEALTYAENMEYAGYDDWRLPNIKELQSIVDYTGSYPAIDQSYFNTTELEENENYYFWSSTSAYFSVELPGNGYGWYVAFGKAVGDDGEDSHGAGAVRFSPKYEESSYAGEGGDNILNSVRLVRDITD